MLRETLSINKNLLTGESVVKTKFKPNNGTMGKVKIELFNENGLVSETHTENIICNSADKILMKAYFDTILNGSATMNTGAIPFNQIQLRCNPDVSQENSNFPLMSGTVLGYVDGETSTSDSSSSEVGRYIPAESFTSYTDGYYQRRRVYEFGANQANGSIDSVCYMPKVVTGKAVEGQIYTIKSSLANSAELYYDYRNRLVKKNGDVCNVILNEEEYLQSTAEPILSEDSIKFIHKRFKAYGDYYIEPSYVNQQGKNGTCATMLTLLIKDENQEEPVETITFDMLQTPEFADIYECLSKSSNSAAGMKIDSFMGTIDNYLYMKVYAGSGSSTTYVFPTVTANGTVTENKAANLYAICVYDFKEKRFVVAPDIRDYRFRSGENFGLPSTFSTFYNLYEDGSVLLIDASSSNNKYKFHKDKFFDGATTINGNMTTCNMTSFNDETGMILHYASSSSRSLCSFLPFNSFTKLPVPIEKDNTSSMKVTYDLFFELPKMFAAPDEAFTWENNATWSEAKFYSNV